MSLIVRIAGSLLGPRSAVLKTDSVRCRCHLNATFVPIASGLDIPQENRSSPVGLGAGARCEPETGGAKRTGEKVMSIDEIS